MPSALGETTPVPHQLKHVTQVSSTDTMAAVYVHVFHPQFQQTSEHSSLSMYNPLREAAALHQ